MNLTEIQAKLHGLGYKVRKVKYKELPYHLHRETFFELTVSGVNVPNVRCERGFFSLGELVRFCRQCPVVKQVSFWEMD